MYPHAENGRAEPRPTRTRIGDPGTNQLKQKEKANAGKGFIMADQKEKAVLAYSGGLDTSCCIKWLQENKGVDVIAVVGDVGQEHEGLEKIKQKALKSGALDCLVVDMRETFAKEYLAKALAANAMYENKYPLVSALSRPLISKHGNRPERKLPRS